MSADTARLSAQHNKLGKPGGPGLFGDPSMQLPAYIQNVAKALMRNGKSKSQAIQIAIGTVKNWAEGKGNVSPEVRAAAAKAVAEWEAEKAKARATPNKSDLSNDVRETPGLLTRILEFATGKKAPKKAAPAKGDKQSAAYGEPDLPKGATGWKHGWIPVDSSGKPVGPAQKPKWLQADEAKHAAAGGKTADQIRAEEGKRALKAQHDRDEAPAKKKAAAKKAAKSKADTEAKAEVRAEQAKQKKAESAKTAAAKKAEAGKTAAQKEKARQIAAAYKQAEADLKAGRKLTPQQQRVVAYVTAQNAKQADASRKVDVPGQKVTAPATPAVAKKATAAKTATTKKAPPKVKAKSYKSASSRATALANVPWGVNAIDLAGSHSPAGQLAFRYKHNWILINPAIPSRGRMGGGLAVKHGHKSGTVTHGHFETHPSGKGKVFVADRTGGKIASAKLAELHAGKSAPHMVDGKINYVKPEQSKYKLAAVQKAPKGDALNPVTPSPADAKAKTTAAHEASAKANGSKSLMDAQVAAKKHADAFVANKKAGNTDAAESHKKLAQGWAKKAQQLKTAEKATKDAKAKYETEQKAKADTEKAAAEKAQAEQIAKKAKDDNAKLKADANAAYKKAVDMPEVTAEQKADKAAAFKESAAKHGVVIQHGGKHDLPEDTLVNAKLSQSQDLAKKLEQDAADHNKANDDLDAASSKADEMSETLSHLSGVPSLHAKTAKAHEDAAKQADALGFKGLKAHHEKKAAEHAKAATEPKAPEAPNVSDAVSDSMDEMGIPSQDLAAWDDYLHASAAYKKDPSAANLKKMAAAQKGLAAKNVTNGEMQDANKKLYKKLGLTPPAAKKTAAKKVAAKKTAAKPPVSSEPVPDINLPGPGMYKDGLAINHAQEKFDAMPPGPKKDALGTAITNAKAKFKAKHGNAFAGDKAGKETGTTSTFVPSTPSGGYSDHITNHPFYNSAKTEGYEPVSNQQNVNNGWKPSDVPGLKSTKGAYTYSGGSYGSINAQLRGSTGPSGGKWDATVKQMDKEFAAVPGLDHDIVTTRKMNDEGPFSTIPPYMEPGGVFVDHGYSSTSKDPAVWSGSVHMQVRIPKGTKALDLNHTVGSQNGSEQEILLDRDTHYKVISDGPNPNNPGVRLIVVEVVPGPKKPQTAA
jgi:hypothetical protein